MKLGPKTLSSVHVTMLDERGRRAVVTIDGEDVSNRVTNLSIAAGVDGPPSVTLTFCPDVLTFETKDGALIKYKG